jgi:MFS transporter, OFA family, oxalate/formate antiporter
VSEGGETKVMNRNLVVVGAILIQLCLGAIYAWSVFTPGLTATKEALVQTLSPQLLQLDAEQTATWQKLKGDISAAERAGDVAAKKTALAAFDTFAKATAPTVSDTVWAKHYYGLTKTQAQAIFAAGLAAFAVVMVLAGRMMPKIGPRRLAMAGGIVLGAGYLLAGAVGGTSFWSVFVLVGLVGGAGIGLGYVVPIAVGMRWFPDKKGLITGLAVAGFGFGALLWVKLAGSWGNLIFSMGIAQTFFIYGIVFVAMVVLGGIWMVFPPEGWRPKGYVPPEAAKAGQKPVAGTVDLTAGQMLRTPQFYMILFCFAFGASAGLMSVGLMKLFPQQALEAGGLSPAEASAIAGTAMAVFFSLANGIGRIAWGMLSDKLGRKTSIMVMMATQGVLVICFQWMAGMPALLFLGAALIGFNFGGNFALFPTITADTFGTKHIGQNYGWVFLAYGVGGIFGPVLGGKLGDAGNFPMAFTICGVLCLLAAGLVAMVKHPKPQTV